MKYVGVVGASGYAGAELLRLLAGHPEMEVSVATAGANAGQRVGDLHPSLVSYGELALQETSARHLSGLDLVFIALPHGQSCALVSDLDPTQAVVDLGADFRLSDPAAWTKYYGGNHAGTWAYGLPELPGQRARLAGNHRVANPGCYATAIQLALAPLIHAGLVSARDIVIVAASGTSGAGRRASEHLLASEVMGSMSSYKQAGAHQHIPEIEQGLSMAGGVPVNLGFTPLLAPMSRGILATCTALVNPGTDTPMVRECLQAAYDSEAFVMVRQDQWPQTSSVLGTNMTVIQGAVDSHSGRVTVVSALDNLGKGAAGQAIQNANLILGISETAGLPREGVAP